MTTENQGLSLTDIGPLFENVTIAEGKALKVFGVSVKGVFLVFQRFPEIAQWFNGGKVDLPSLMTQAPEAVAAVIAAGCGQAGVEEAESVAGQLPVEAQLDVLEAIGRLTFKNGFGPFVQRIVALSVQAQSLNYGRAQGTKLPQGLKPVSQPV